MVTGLPANGRGPSASLVLHLLSHSLALAQAKAAKVTSENSVIKQSLLDAEVWAVTMVMVAVVWCVMVMGGGVVVLIGCWFTG